MIIDCFAGGGGASTGIEQALGRSPDVAINHNAKALALHQANHPKTLHLDSNIWDVEPTSVAKGRKIGLLWASPDCKHFSKAKGGAPKDRNIRDLAWAVVKWAKLPKEQRPDVILMENVEEFRTWGPICDDGKVIKGLEGVTFELWVKALRDLGYKLDWRELRGCDYGAPTIRKRFFMVARCDGRKVAWPKPTHGDPASDAVKAGRLKPWRTAAECIDWSLPCPSIFDTSEEIKEKHGLRAVRPLADNTLARVARGMKRYVLDAERPFVVNLTHGARLEDVAEPFRTIAGANRGEKAIVAPSLIRHFGQSTGQRADNPAPTVTAGGGGKTGLIAPSITRFNSGATGHRIDEPMATVTANSFIKRPGGAAPIGVLTPTLLNVANSKTTGRGPNAWSIKEPTRTVTSASGLSLAVPHLLSLKGTDRRDGPVTAPHPTVLAGGNHSALVSPILTYAQQGGRNRAPLDPMHTICASRKDQNSVIIPALIQTGYGERKGQAPRALDPHTPLGTAVAGGVKHAPVAAFLAQHNKARSGHNPGRTANAPISTVTATGSQQGPVAAFFAKYYGTGDGARTDAPCHTVTTKDRFSHVQAELAAPVFSEEHKERARQVAGFLRAHDAWDGGEFVTLTLDGETFVVIDIGLRMLSPRELFNAQGFPPDYVIEGVWHQNGEEWTFEAFTKSTQVSCCGNSVCPDLARALAEANCQHLTTKQRRAA